MKWLELASKIHAPKVPDSRPIVAAMLVVLQVIALVCRVLWTYMEALVALVLPRGGAKDVRGMVVLLTGAGRGIGRELALKLAERGTRLALLDVDEASVRETAQLVTEFGHTAVAYKCDVTSERDVSEVATRVRRDLGEVDALFNNAGVMAGKPLLELDERQIRRTFDVNVLAHFWTLKEFLPAMLQRRSGHIVCTCSMSGKEGSPLLTDYTASKFAANGLMLALESELHHLQADYIHLTTVYPMAVDTRLVSDIAQHAQWRGRFNPLLTVDLVASTIVNGFLFNQREVFIPDHLKNVDFWTSVLTRKGKRMVADFIDAGFTQRA
jgi:all-trans-retinol dehydrogenase (NAD+)